MAMMSMDQHREAIESLAEMTGQEVTRQFLTDVIKATSIAIERALAHGNTTDEKIAEMKDMVAQATIMRRALA